MAQRQITLLNLRSPESAGIFEQNFPPENIIDLPLTQFKPFEVERIASLLDHIHADYPAGFGGLVFTSAKAARSLSQSQESLTRIKAMLRQDPAPIFCVGQATKNAVEALELGSVYVGEGGAKELAKLACETLGLKESQDEKVNMLFPCGVHIHDKTMPSFLDHNIKLVPLRVYDMPKDESAEERLASLIEVSGENDEAHYIMPFFSMRTLEIFAEMVHAVESDKKGVWMARHSALCLSPVMVKLAQNIGFENIITANSPNALSMREAMDALLKS